VEGELPQQGGVRGHEGEGDRGRRGRGRGRGVGGAAPPRREQGPQGGVPLARGRCQSIPSRLASGARGGRGGGGRAVRQPAAAAAASASPSICVGGAGVRGAAVGPSLIPHLPPTQGIVGEVGVASTFPARACVINMGRRIARAAVEFILWRMGTGHPPLLLYRQAAMEVSDLSCGNNKANNILYRFLLDNMIRIFSESH
jgi:hypothetical protein